MDKSTALSTLRLSGEPERQAIITAYTRLARRYPMHQFPERHSRLLQAKEALLNPEMRFRDILFENKADIDWYQPPEQTTTGQGSSLQQSLTAILRPVMRSVTQPSPELDPLSFLQDMMEQLGPDELAKLIEEDWDKP